MLRRLQSFVDPFAFAPSGAPAATVWAFLVEHLRPLRFVIALSLTLTVVGASIEVWLIGYAGQLVDTLASTSPLDLWATHGIGLVIAAAIVLIARPLTALLREGLDDVAFRPNAETLIRWRTHRHVLGQSVGWFRHDLAGRIAGMVAMSGTAATGAAYQVIHTLSFVAAYIVGSVWLVGAVDLRLVFPLAIWIALYALMLVWIVPRYRRASEEFQEAQAVMTGNLVDTYGNIDTIKLFADAREEEREGRSIFGATLRTFFGVQRVEVTMNAGMLFLGSLLMVGLVGYGIVLWQQGAAPVGLVAIAVALSFRITAMAEWLLDAMSSLFGHLGALRQALKTVAQPHAVTDLPDARDLVVTGGAIRFTGVTHRYGKDGIGLDDLTLSIAAGEKVGIVGRSGAGKSTLVNLVLRFFDAEAGAIEIDGQDIRAVTQESLRRNISMVTQEAALLHRSVRENIAYGRTDIGEAAIAAAAAKAAADRFIPALRDREGRTSYDAQVGERGVTLSGGQRQRIALARAILKDAPILILDEATSALDSEVEAAIQETLDAVMNGKTVIAVAHRLSTIARMDRIVVLDQGRVAEAGTHDQLLARAGIYAELWSLQSGGFLGDH
jgi:ATP-binding cassette subfamily B multidrug efflux pump